MRHSVAPATQTEFTKGQEEGQTAFPINTRNSHLADQLNHSRRRPFVRLDT